VSRRPVGGTGSLRGPPDLRVFNHDCMRREVTVELARGREVIAVERTSLARGSNQCWRNLLDDAGDYRVVVSLRYGPSETAEWTVERPRRAGLDVVLRSGDVHVHPGGRRL